MCPLISSLGAVTTSARVHVRSSHSVVGSSIIQHPNSKIRGLNRVGRSPKWGLFPPSRFCIVGKLESSSPAK